MPTHCTPDLFGFAPVQGRSVVAASDGGAMTLDGGALLLGATDRAVGLIDRFAGSTGPESPGASAPLPAQALASRRAASSFA